MWVTFIKKNNFTILYADTNKTNAFENKIHVTQKLNLDSRWR